MDNAHVDETVLVVPGPLCFGAADAVVGNESPALTGGNLPVQAGGFGSASAIPHMHIRR